MAAIVVDFTNVKEGSGLNTKRIPAGDYVAKVVNVDDGKAKDGTPMLRFDITPNAHQGSCLPYYCKLQENQLWKLRSFLMACGVNVPKGKLKFDPKKIVGKTVGIEVDDDEYDGNEKSVVVACFKPAEDEPAVTKNEDVPADVDDDDEDELDLDDL